METHLGNSMLRLVELIRERKRRRDRSKKKWIQKIEELGWILKSNINNRNEKTSEISESVERVINDNIRPMGHLNDLFLTILFCFFC